MTFSKKFSKSFHKGYLSISEQNEEVYSKKFHVSLLRKKLGEGITAKDNLVLRASFSYKRKAKSCCSSDMGRSFKPKIVTSIKVKSNFSIC